MEFEIRAFDPYVASEAEWQSFNQLINGHEYELYPEDPPTTWEVQRRLWSVEIPEMRRFLWLAAGYAECNLEDLEENRHLAFCDLYVAPQWRRRGLGSRLLGRLVECAQANGRRTLISSIDDPIPAGLAFTRQVGGESGLEMHYRQLELAQVDRARLLDWRQQAAGLRESGAFELMQFEQRYPEDRLEQICRMIESMNEAPRGSLDMADQKWTPELLRQMDAFNQQRGVDRWTMAVYHEPSGVFAGYTEILLPPDKPQAGYQGATSVRPEFRNQGLGRWLKAEMALKVLAERPQIRYLRTSNADVNAPMLKINAEMGFKIHHARIWVQAPVATLMAYVRL